jgi:hypothetical protein
LYHIPSIYYLLKKGVSCVVEGVSSPTVDSDINFEVWMLAISHWSQKFNGVDNGGWPAFEDRKRFAYEDKFLIKRGWGV